MSHTNGPWFSRGLTIEGPDGSDLADVTPGLAEYGVDESEANADLIALAPQMHDFITRLCTEDFRRLAPEWHKEGLSLLKKEPK